MAGRDIAATDESAKVIAQLTALTRYGEDQVWRTAEKALALIRAQRVQNGALRSLNASLEAEIAIHRNRASDYHAAATTLDSEKEANARLTDELDAIEAEARRYAAHYPQGSDGRNTFVMFAEFVAGRALSSPIPDTLNAGGCE